VEVVRTCGAKWSGLNRSRHAASPTYASGFPDHNQPIDQDSLKQAQLAGAGDGFGSALHLEFAEDFPIVTLHCI